MSVSAVLITYNEAACITQALDSVTWADEIIVVDSGSHDKTREICEAKGANVSIRPFDNFSAQKNHAMNLATGEWLILLDADEVLSALLIREIQDTIASPVHDAYWIKRKVTWLGKPLRFGGLQSEKVLRLVKRNISHYEREVHEELLVTGSVGELDNAMWHHTTPTMEDYKRKHRAYIRLDVRMRLKAGKKIHLLKCYGWPPMLFFRKYIIQGGFLDGWHGLKFQLAAAHYVWAKYMLLYRRNKRRNTKS